MTAKTGAYAPHRTGIWFLLVLVSGSAHRSGKGKRKERREKKRKEKETRTNQGRGLRSLSRLYAAELGFFGDEEACSFGRMSSRGCFHDDVMMVPDVFIFRQISTSVYALVILWYPIRKSLPCILK